jgi:hypothetical protein
MKRYGANIGGKEMSLGIVPQAWEDSPPKGFAGSLLDVRAKLLPIVQTYHEQQQEQQRAGLKWQEAKIPDPRVRQIKVRENQRKLAHLKQLKNSIDAAAVGFEIERMQIPYSKQAADIAIRGELRSAMRAADDKKRQALLAEDRAFRDAALEAPPALSGLTPQTHAHLRESEIAARFPDELKVVNEWKQALEVVAPAIKAADAAIAHELTQLDLPEVEREPVPVRRVAWK